MWWRGRGAVTQYMVWRERGRSPRADGGGGEPWPVVLVGSGRAPFHGKVAVGGRRDLKAT